MRLSYKQDAFDAPRLAAWVDALHSQGQDVQAEWSRDGQPAPQEQATAFALRLGGRKVFEQLRRACTFYLADAESSAQHPVLASARTAGVFVPPRFGSAFVCLGIYALAQAWALAVFPEAFLRLLVPSYAFLGVGHYLWFSRCDKGQAEPRLPPLLMVMPAIILSAPSSLLNIPVFGKYNHLYWWRRAGQPAVAGIARKQGAAA